MITIYTTTATREEAKKMAHSLIKMKAIACANIFEVESTYAWKGRLCDEPEFAIIMKTIKPFSVVKKEIKKLHKYEVPLIECWKTDANKEYLEWMTEQANMKPSI